MSTPKEEPVYTTDDRTPEESPVEWLPTGPDLDGLTAEEREALAAEVALIDAEKHEQMGH